MNNSHFYQIKNFYPFLKNPNKYTGKEKIITCRSGWEIKFCKRCDSHPDILEWSSEEIVIKYISPLDGKYHNYFIDFWVKLKQKNNYIKELLVEIKPYKQTIEPIINKRKSKNYIKEVNTYLVNQAKWKYAKDYCNYLVENENKNIEFITLTEKDCKFI